MANISYIQLYKTTEQHLSEFHIDKNMEVGDWYVLKNQYTIAALYAFAGGVKMCGDGYVRWVINSGEALDNMQKVIGIIDDQEHLLHKLLTSIIEWINKSSNIENRLVAVLDYGDVALSCMSYEECMTDNDPNEYMKAIEETS